jgi:hypothetical protein
MSTSAVRVSNSNHRSRRFAFGKYKRLVSAVRPLAASARLADSEANQIQGCAGASNFASFTAARTNRLCSSSLACPSSLPHGFVRGPCSLAGSHARRSLPLGRKMRAFAGSAELTTMQAQAVHRAPPNPSIERTRPGKPGRASHVKR